MRKILFVLLLVIISIGDSWGQEYIFEYDVEFSLKTSKNRRYSLSGEITTTSGQKIKIEGFSRSKVRGNQHLKEIVRYPASYGAIENIYIWTTYDRKKMLWSNVCKSNGYLYLGTSQNCFSLDESSLDFRCFERNASLKKVNTFNYYPALSLNSTFVNSIGEIEASHYLPDDDKLKIEATKGFPTSVYKWKYATSRDSIRLLDRWEYTYDWKDVPQYCYNTTGNVFSATGKELLGDNIIALYGKSIYLSIDLGCGDKRSNILDFIITKSAPHILNTFAASKTCYGGANGKLKVQLDRALLSGERLMVDYKNLTTLSMGSISDPALGKDNSFYIENLDAGEYEIQVSGFYKGNSTYSDDVDHKKQSKIESFPLIAYSTAQKKNIGCFGDNSGSFTVKAEGGSGIYTLHWRKQGGNYVEADFAASTEITISNLFFGAYEYYVTDDHDCELRDIEGNIITRNETLTQPVKPLTFAFQNPTEPSGYGRSDGFISFVGDGGTPFSGNTYTSVWKNKETGTLVEKVSNDVSDNKFKTTAQNLPAGSYTVEIKDANNCILTAELTLDQPDELLANIEETHYISCNGMSDGQLVAHVTGGIRNPNPNQLTYSYQWYKEEPGKGYILLIHETDSVLQNMPIGSYKVEIEDFSRVVNTTSANYELKQPELLQASATNVEITCWQTANISAKVTGGTAPYTYQWSTGDETASVDSVAPGRYFVFVTDSRGCEATAVAHVSTPDGLRIKSTVSNPVCNGAANGSIRLDVSGGTKPYTYKWSMGATTKDLSNIKAGLYMVVVTDRDSCSFTENFILSDPELLTVSLGEDRTLCNAQSVKLAPTVSDPKTKFSWTGPDSFRATSSEISVNKPGTYKLTITDSKGCQAMDEIHIKTRNLDISSEIFVATEVFAGDTVVVANISNPTPDRVEWLIDRTDSLKVVEKDDYYARVIFSDPGYYSIGFRAHREDCFQETYKTITVLDRNHIDDDSFGESIIEEYYVYPNPNDGRFNVKITLNRTSAIRLRIINIGSGSIFSDKSYAGKKEYDIPYQMVIPPGVYVVVLETVSGHMNFKMIVR